MIALLVDDDTTCQMIHKALLTSFNVDAITVSEGEDAIDLFKVGLKFDFVMIDKHMRPMDGVETTTILRAMGVKDLIVGIANELQPNDKELFLDAGADLVYDKPMTREKVALILKALENK